MITCVVKGGHPQLAQKPEAMFWSCWSHAVIWGQLLLTQPGVQVRLDGAAAISGFSLHVQVAFYDRAMFYKLLTFRLPNLLYLEGG